MARVYPCKLCPESFTNKVYLGGHMRAAHPEYKRPLPKFLRTPARAPRGPSRKRASDTWPARP